MVNIGILGGMDCGKTSVFALAMSKIAETEEKILTGAPGGPEKYTTRTVDFLRFTWKGFIHVLYGTGGHNTPITDYYRVYVLRNANRFLCMFDLSIPLKPQLDFYRKSVGIIPIRSVTIFLNKYDLAPENLEKYKTKIEDFFINDMKKMIKNVYTTVAVETGNEFEEYNKNCLKGIISQCEFDADSSAFDVWDGQ